MNPEGGNSRDSRRDPMGGRPLRPEPRMARHHPLAASHDRFIHRLGHLQPKPPLCSQWSIGLPVQRDLLEVLH